jgi:hypothetical protein
MRAIGSFLALALLFVALPAAAQSYDWSTVGAVGLAPPGVGHDFADASFTFGGSRTGTLRARYPVTNTYGGAISKSPAWTTLWISYTDDSSLGSVTARLFEVDKCNNTQTQICQVVSTDGTLDPQCSSCTFGSGTFDFANNTYYVEVAIQRNLNSGATESLHSLGIQ